jgi:hypothetical protein
MFLEKGEALTPLGQTMKLVKTTHKTTVTAKYAVMLDVRAAVQEGIAQNLLIEVDKIISKKIEEAAISDETSFAVLADGAIRQFEWAS